MRAHTVLMTLKSGVMDNYGYVFQSMTLIETKRLETQSYKTLFELEGLVFRREQTLKYNLHDFSEKQKFTIFIGANLVLMTNMRY